ncbi:MAG: phosphopentomutase [Coriobacteriia bacterium]|nr:phosphopentomutase [Coriobacteriia bacterium]
MSSRRRAIVIILDSLGVGALPDAADYGDVGTNTLQHVAQAVGGLILPTLQSLGLGNITPTEGVLPIDHPLAACDKLVTFSQGKDTIAGHWELMGLVSHRAFPAYPQGFPPEVTDAFVRLTGYGWLGNYPASGTDIIAQLGAQHMATGKPIIYTSADSVFQVAAHTDIIPLDELYRICQITRDEILVGDHACARVIARPFTGSEQAGFVRTADRQDYALSPSAPTALNRLQDAGIPSLCIGKIADIFNGQGIDTCWPTKSNAEGMTHLDHALDTVVSGLIFANLVDFDMLWGHRRDPQGYAKGLEEFDHWLATFLPKLGDNDVLLITADHGCDPTHAGTDHTREYVPLLTYCNDPSFLGRYSESRLSAARNTKDKDLCKTAGKVTKNGHAHSLAKVATIIEEYLLQDAARD